MGKAANRKKDPTHRVKLLERRQRREATFRALAEALRPAPSPEPDSAIEARRPVGSLHRARMAAVLLAGLGVVTAVRSEPDSQNVEGG